MRFRVTWNGVVRKATSVETPADALYWIWSRYRDDFAGGTIEVGLDEDGDPEAGNGLRLARVTFPVRIARDIEAENPAEAVYSFLHDDRLPSSPETNSITVTPADDPPPLEDPPR